MAMKTTAGYESVRKKGTGRMMRNGINPNNGRSGTADEAIF